MKNNLFRQFGARPNNAGIQNDGFNGRFNSMEQFVDEYNQFSKTITGDPQKQVQELLDSGKMTQQQYNMLYGLAKKIAGVK